MQTRTLSAAMAEALADTKPKPPMAPPNWWVPGRLIKLPGSDAQALRSIGTHDAAFGSALAAFQASGWPRSARRALRLRSRYRSSSARSPSAITARCSSVPLGSQSGPCSQLSHLSSLAWWLASGASCCRPCRSARGAPP
jgi:hypothetical protein